MASVVAMARLTLLQAARRCSTGACGPTPRVGPGSARAADGSTPTDRVPPAGRVDGARSDRAGRADHPYLALRALSDLAGRMDRPRLALICAPGEVERDLPCPAAESLGDRRSLLGSRRACRHGPHGSRALVPRRVSAHVSSQPPAGRLAVAQSSLRPARGLSGSRRTRHVSPRDARARAPCLASDHASSQPPGGRSGRLSSQSPAHHRASAAHRSRGAHRRDRPGCLSPPTRPSQAAQSSIGRTPRGSPQRRLAVRPRRADLQGCIPAISIASRSRRREPRPLLAACSQSAADSVVMDPRLCPPHDWRAYPVPRGPSPLESAHGSVRRARRRSTDPSPLRSPSSRHRLDDLGCHASSLPGGWSAAWRTALSPRHLSGRHGSLWWRRPPLGHRWQPPLYGWRQPLYGRRLPLNGWRSTGRRCAHRAVGPPLGWVGGPRPSKRRLAGSTPAGRTIAFVPPRAWRRLNPTHRSVHSRWHNHHIRARYQA